MYALETFDDKHCVFIHAGKTHDENKIQEIQSCWHKTFSFFLFSFTEVISLAQMVSRKSFSSESTEI